MDGGDRPRRIARTLCVFAENPAGSPAPFASSRKTPPAPPPLDSLAGARYLCGMTRERKRDFALLLAATFFYFTGPMAVAPLVTGIAGSLGAGEALMGLAGGLMNGVSLLSRPVVGNLADAVGKRALTIGGAALMAAAGAGYLLAGAPWAVLAVRVLHGLGFAACSVSLSTWISELLPRERVAWGMGLYGMMTAVGMAVGPAAGVFLYQHAGYGWAFTASTLLSATLALLAWCVRDRGKSLPAARDPAMPRRFRLVEWRVAPVAAIILLFAMPYMATQAFLVPLAEAEGLNFSVGWFFPLYAAVLVALRLGLSRVFDRVPFWVFLFASVASAGGALLALAAMRGFWMMALAAALMAGGYGIMCTACQSTAILLARPGGRGLANGTYYIGIDLGMTLGPLCGGFLFGHAPLAWFYPAFLLTLPLILLVHALWWRRARKTA